MLSPNEQDEIMNYIDCLLSSKNEEVSYTPALDWAGGLAFLKEKYTSIELLKTACG